MNQQRYDITGMVYKFLPEEKHIQPIQSIYQQRVIAFYNRYPTLLQQQVTDEQLELTYWRNFVSAPYHHFMDWELFQHIKAFSFDLQGNSCI